MVRIPNRSIENNKYFRNIKHEISENTNYCSNINLCRFNKVCNRGCGKKKCLETIINEESKSHKNEEYDRSCTLVQRRYPYSNSIKK